MNSQIQNYPGNMQSVQESMDDRKPILVIESLSKSYQEGRKNPGCFDQAALEALSGAVYCCPG